MTLRPLHLLGSPPLRERSSEVGTVDEETRCFIDDLYETMDGAKGVGLAANQVGVTTRIAVVDADGHRFTMINPVIVEQEGQDTAEEGCLSIPDLYADVTRATRVILEALDRDGRPFRLEAEGLKARVIQHEIDHLDGILFVDRLSPLKRKLLTTRWRKSRKGTGHIQEIQAASDTKA
jgi:peptide deformylase